MTTLKNIALATTVAAASLAAAPTMANHEIDSRAVDYVASWAQAFNADKSIPKLPDGTPLTFAASLDSYIFVYFYTSVPLNQNGPKVDANRAKLRAAFLVGICTEIETVNILNMGATMVFGTMSSDGYQMSQDIATHDDC